MPRLTQQEIEAYEAAGWQRYVGILWYDEDAQYASEIDTLDEINVADIQDYYNEGYSLHVIYHWLLDGRLIGKQTEQSVYAGRWKLSPEEAMAYYENGYVVPEIVTNVDCLPEYYSLWYYDAKECAEPRSDDPLYAFVRIEYDCYDFGFGSMLWLKNGGFAENDKTGNHYYTYKEYWDMASTGFDYEMVHWQ